MLKLEFSAISFVESALNLSCGPILAAEAEFKWSLLPEQLFARLKSVVLTCPALEDLLKRVWNVCGVFLVAQVLCVVLGRFKVATRGGKSRGRASRLFQEFRGAY